MKGPENHLNKNQPNDNSQDREEIIRLRKVRREKEKLEKESRLDYILEASHESLKSALIAKDFSISEDEDESLKQKLKYYILKNPSILNSEVYIDPNTLADAVIDSPHCVSDPNCGIKGLLDAHERKILVKIAETRKLKAEQTGEEFNPYEALFETGSGEYYMARLLNMPHLKEESQFMKNCVGTSDSYVNRIKKGEIEILSFRHTPKFNQETQKLDVDKPILTIEYNLRTKTIDQIKGFKDAYLTGKEPYLQDVLEALRRLKESENDSGEKRDFQSINPSELQSIKIEDYYVFTEKGSIPFEKYDEVEHGFILKAGNMFIDANTDKYFALKILKFKLGIALAPYEFAQNRGEVDEQTKLYIGPLYPNIFKELPQTIEHIYTKFPEREIYITTINLPEEPKPLEEYRKQIITNGFDDETDYVLSQTDLSQGKGQTYKIIIPTVASLGFTKNATTQEIQDRAKELGLGYEFLPPSIGLELLLQIKEQKSGEHILIDMAPITDRFGRRNVFNTFVDRRSDSRLLIVDGVGSVDEWGPDDRWAFSQGQ